MPADSPRSSRPAWLLPVAVVAAAALLVALILVVNRDGETTADTGEQETTRDTAPTEVEGPAQADFLDAERRDADDLLAAGPVDAPVTLVVFSDYQCPFCAQWSDETLPLMMEHVEDGDLRVEWRDVNVFGPASERAARASYAAAEQDAFWEYHDELFAGGETRSEDDLSDDALSALADELGLGSDQFEADFASEETAQQVADNQQLGIDLGAYSTPAFILGGQPIVGAQPSRVFVDAFDDALSAAE